MNKHSLKIGLSFGSTSGIITTLGLMLGLYFSTASRSAVIGGILTIAFADSLSDALGIHISEESENIHSNKDIWLSTISTFIFKLIITLTFLIPIFLFSLKLALFVGVLWGIFLLSILSYKLAHLQKINFLQVAGEHLLVAIVVIILTYFLGTFISAHFK